MESEANKRPVLDGPSPWKDAAPWLVWGLVFVLFGLAASRHPLFGVVSYELAFLTSVLVGLAGLHLGPMAFRRWRRTHPGFAPLGPSASLALLARLYWSAVWPLLVMAAAAANEVWALGRWRCNQLQGLWYFLLLPGVTALVAGAMGLSAALVFERLWAQLAAGATMVLTIWAWGLWRFYANPPVAIYDPIVGYFSGNLYDELLLLDKALVWARLFHLLEALSLLGLSAWLGKNSPFFTLLSRSAKRKLASLTLGLVLVTGLVSAQRTRLGFDLDASAIRSRLGGLAESPHFLLVYDRTKMKPRDATKILLDAEFRHHQLSRFFGTSPQGRITIYLFGSALQKKRILGAHQVEMAKPWRKEIYITDLGFPHPVIKHELAHVFAGSFGDPVFAVSFRWTWWMGLVPIPNFNPGLIEGAAVAADWPPSNLNPDEKVRALGELGWKVPLSSVMGYSFFANSAVRSYSVAGSFCRFLVKRYGAEKFRRLYRSGGAFQSVYHKSLTELEREWQEHIARVPLPRDKLALAKRMLQRRSIFASPCVHKVAALEQKAASLPPAKAREIHQLVCSLDPADPGHLWALLADQVALDLLPEAMGAGLAILKHPNTTRPSKARLFLVLGDLLWKKQRLDLARAFYQQAQRFASRPDQTRAILVRLDALRDPKVRPTVRKLLLEGDKTAIGNFSLLLRRKPSWAIGYYLLGSWMLFNDRPTQAAFALRHALKGPLPTGPLRWEAALRLGRARFALGRYESAANLFERLSRSPIPKWIQRLAADWAERCDWMAKQGGRIEVKILR